VTGTVWIEVRAVLSEAPEDWSPFADALDRFGCPGSLLGDQPPSISGYLVSVAGTAARTEELRAELIRLGAASVLLSEVAEEDWSETWRKHFKPRRVGKRLVVRPTWESFRAERGDVELVLDPGQAFGTGDHATTRLCLELLDEADLEGRSVLDLGCGSGILSIAADKLGAKSVLGADIEALSVEVACQNAKLNRSAAEFIVSDGFDDRRLDGPWDVVVSNIISATLIRLSTEAASHLEPGGLWIVSGIIRQNWPDVRAAAAEAGFSLESERDEDDWVAAVFRKP
jgi:ribosomal protein L11 methyltransferase